MPSIAMVMMMLVASLLGAVPAVEGVTHTRTATTSTKTEGRDCSEEDVFFGENYTIANAIVLIRECTTLKFYKDVIGTSTKDDVMTVIAEAMKNTNTALTTLDLSGNAFGDGHVTAIAEALKNNTALTFLDLNDNSIGDSGAAALAEALKSNTALTTLDLNSNFIGDSGAAALAEALKGNTALTELNLYGNPGAALFDALQRINDNTATTLDLGDNDIGDSGAAAIAEALKGNAALTKLDLDDNDIGDIGAAAIADAMKSNTALTSLDLGYNKIGDRGAAAIAEALKINTALTELDLDSNRIGDSGAVAIAEALKNNTALTSLTLYGNSIGDSGAAAIADALKSNTALTIGYRYTQRDDNDDTPCTYSDGRACTVASEVIRIIAFSGAGIMVCCAGYYIYKKNKNLAAQDMAQQPDLYPPVSAGLGGGNKVINMDVGHADSSAGKAKESFSGFDNGTSDDEI